jgi:nickel/cobalt transporter (NiCoT) family protein
MLTAIKDLFDESAPDLKARIVTISAVLAVLNMGAWLWAFIAFHANPTMLGVALVVYGLGLRHAVDADHIAAIDNVTRKLMQENRRPVTVGFFFAMGHSTVVIIAAAAVAVTATLLPTSWCSSPSTAPTGGFGGAAPTTRRISTSS